jgi:hypothetical protein
MKIIYLTILFAFFSQTSFAQLTGHSKFVMDLKSNLQCPDSDAQEIATAVYSFIHAVETHFSNCAKGSTQYFTSADSLELCDLFVQDATIYVSSLNKSRPTSYKLPTYISRLKRQGMNFTVSLYFDKKTLKFTTIDQNGNDSYSFSTTIYQIYQSRKKNGELVYGDATKKKFNWLLEKRADGTFALQIKSITVSETIQINKYFNR